MNKTHYLLHFLCDTCHDEYMNKMHGLYNNRNTKKYININKLVQSLLNCRFTIIMFWSWYFTSFKKGKQLNFGSFTRAIINECLSSFRHLWNAHHVQQHSNSRLMNRVPDLFASQPRFRLRWYGWNKSEDGFLVLSQIQLLFYSSFWSALIKLFSCLLWIKKSFKTWDI